MSFAGTLSFACAALAGAAGPVASQVVGNAIGAQDGFSWKQVALAAVSAGVTQGVGASGYLPNSLGTVGNAALRAAVSSAVSQGISVSLGLQDRFSWTQVAASAVGAGVGAQINSAMNYNPQVNGFDLGKSVLSATGAALATTVMRGGRVSVTQVATDAFGNVLGQSLAGTNKPTALAGVSQAGATDDPLGDFIAQNQGSWNQRQQFVDAFRNPVRYSQADDVQLAAGPGYDGGIGQSDRERNIARMQDLANEPEAIGFGTTLRGAPSGLVDMAPTRANAIRLGLMGPDGQVDGAWSSPVAQANVVGVPLPLLGSSVMGPSLPEIELQQRYVGGVTQAVSMGWSEAFNSNNSIGERLIYGGLALAGTPNMMVESMLYSPLNVKPAASEMGQYIARAGLQTDSSERNMDILRAVGAGAEAVGNAGAWLVGPRPQATGMSASEVAELRTAGTRGVGNTALSPASEVKLGLQTLDPTTVSFTQSSVSYGKAGASYNLDTLVQSMSKDGWVGKPIDVVAMPDGTLASIDNTRVLAARQARINVEANVRGFDEAITDPVRQLSLTEKGNVPDTWGDAALLRINKPIQNATYPGMHPGWSVRFPYGSIYDPVVKY